jgi:neutral amino acid transport system ATP-binding protein
MSAVLLEVEHISRSFGGVAALDSASFAVEEGSIAALIGPNGAGKTTAFSVISGFLKPDAGVIRFAGRRIEGLRGDLVARAGLVRAFQAPRVLTRMSVLDNMQLEVQHRAIDLLELLRLLPLAETYAGTLSGGQRKLLELGRSLMVEPRMILLDEPMAGVAPVLAEQLLEHIRRLRAERGVTFCVIEHDMDVVMSISDRVIVMDEGRVIAAGTPEAIQHDERVIEAYLGRLGQVSEPAIAGHGSAP